MNPEYDLVNFSLRDMTECGHALRKIGGNAKNMEDVANGVVRYMYDHLADSQTGKNACVLIRFFKTHRYGGLDDKLRRFAQGMLQNPLLPEMKCLTLLATVGEKPEWCSKEHSYSHKAIPLPSEEAVKQIPMISNLIQQFGLDINTIVKPDSDLLLEINQKTYNVFHVPEAVGSLYIPAQKEFVIPYGVKSVLGFGGLLPAGDMFAVILFSKAPISREKTSFFKTLALSVKMAILPFEETVFTD